MKVLQSRKPERLYDTLTEQRGGVRVWKKVKESKFKGRKLLLTTKKSWSIRSLRWLEQMPQDLRSNDTTLRSTKTELKRWVKHHIPVRGDRILWGKKLSEEHIRRRANEAEESEEPDPPDSPEVEEEEDQHQAGIQESINREEIRRGETAGGDLNPRRVDSQGGGQYLGISKARNFLSLVLLLLMMFGVHVATVQRQEDRITVTGRIRSLRKRNTEIWRGRLSGVQRQGGHKGGMGRVSCGEG